MRQWLRRWRDERSRKDHWRWGKLAVRTLSDPGTFAAVGIHPVDSEVIPHFDGRPDDMEAWLIFATVEEASAAAERSDQVRTAIADGLVRAGFPADAAASFRVLFTSTPEIEAGGGRFYFFR
jgi:hypothetical protein